MTTAMHTSMDLDARLAREREHFDAHYANEAAGGIRPLSDSDRKRYALPASNTIYPREYFYHLLSPLKGKNLLEIACGNGIDASIAAYNKANVHAYDLSRKSVEMTRRRATVNGVAGNVRLEVGGVFEEAFEGQTFDAITGYAALHHLPVPLEELAAQIYDRLNPGGLAVFAEPVINSKTLHVIRRCIPIAVAEDTEDEMPLNDRDIEAFAAPFDRMVRREFQMISRIWPLLPSCWPVTRALHQVDAALLKMRMFRRYATVVVFAVYRDR